MLDRLGCLPRSAQWCRPWCPWCRRGHPFFFVCFVPFVVRMPLRTSCRFLATRCGLTDHRTGDYCLHRRLSLIGGGGTMALKQEQ